MPASNLEPLYAAQANNLELALDLAANSLDACQKLTELGVQTMKESIADSQVNMRKAFAAKDAQELLAWQVSLVEPAAERTRAYLQQVYEIAAAARASFQKAAEARYHANLGVMQQAFDSATQSAPTGAESPLNAWQSAIASTATLYESMQQATRHAFELAENRVIAADAAATNAARKARSQAAAAAAKP